MLWFQPLPDPCGLSSVVCYEESPEYLIEKYADDVPTAKRIATCESQMGKYRTNWSGSSAEGLFMFMPKTWNAYCDGDIKSDIDQIKCFNKLYPTHKSWWECQ
jgi:hypothetical protein